MHRPWLFLLLLLAVTCTRATPPETIEAGRMGRIALFAPEGDRAALVYLFSDGGGWSAAYTTVARELARQGAAVVGVDLPSYLKGLSATTEDECHYTVAEIEDWSHRFQRQLGFERYRSPILAGVGAGATLAYAALAQSPAATVAGAIGVEPAPALATRVPLCTGAPSHPVAGGFAYDPVETLPGFWQEVPPEEGQPPLARLEAALETAIEEGNATEDAELADLPLVEIPSDTPSDRFAVIYSGDGGWRDLDKEIGESLAAHGTPTVGVDSLRYFWSAKQPETVATDLARIIRHYRKEWQANEALLVGYSFGADILPFAVNRLPPDVRPAVRQISLLGLEPRAPFEIAVTGWLGSQPEDAPLVLPELEKIDPTEVQCFYGEEEEDTLCTNPALARAQVIRTTGGHHFDGDYEALAERILEGAAHRSAVPPPH